MATAVAAAATRAAAAAAASVAKGKIPRGLRRGSRTAALLSRRMRSLVEREYHQQLPAHLGRGALIGYAQEMEEGGTMLEHTPSIAAVTRGKRLETAKYAALTRYVCAGAVQLLNIAGKLALLTAPSEVGAFVVDAGADAKKLRSVFLERDGVARTAPPPAVDVDEEETAELQQHVVLVVPSVSGYSSLPEYFRRAGAQSNLGAQSDEDARKLRDMLHSLLGHEGFAWPHSVSEVRMAEIEQRAFVSVADFVAGVLGVNGDAGWGPDSEGGFTPRNARRHELRRLLAHALADTRFMLQQLCSAKELGGAHAGSGLPVQMLCSPITAAVVEEEAAEEEEAEEESARKKDKKKHGKKHGRKRKRSEDGDDYEDPLALFGDTPFKPLCAPPLKAFMTLLLSVAKAAPAPPAVGGFGAFVDTLRGAEKGAALRKLLLRPSEDESTKRKRRRLARAPPPAASSLRLHPDLLAVLPETDGPKWSAFPVTDAETVRSMLQTFSATPVPAFEALREYLKSDAPLVSEA